MPRLWLKRGREKSIKEGYLWIHPSDVEKISPSAQDGSAVDIVDSKDRFLARALLNRRSPIVARIFSREKRPWGSDLVLSRLKRAIERRERWGISKEAFRVCYGESDGLPGLVVDKYARVAVIQTSHPALEPMKQEVARALQEMLDLAAVYEKSDTPARAQEGLPASKGVLLGSLPSEIRISEGDVQFLLDIEEGQKTGHYLDQRPNRMRVGSMANGREVLDLFSYTGGFGLHCLAKGAERVVFVDSSGGALKIARLNVEALGAEGKAEFLEGNCFDILRQMERQGRTFDMVCLDPPAFAPSKSSLPSATKGYKELNLRALKILREGGILVSCSCSSHLPVGLHLDIIVEASADARCQTVLLHQWGQGLDHPVLPGHPPSRYLKCHVLELTEIV